MTALLSELRTMIATDGPITVERYMALCLQHPAYGYYMTRDRFGQGGDFTTAPEISQMFGELIGLWTAQVWSDMGRPAHLHLVELGPGRGTLMADLIRASRVAPGFLDAVEIHLVETSPVLRAAQRATLGAECPLSWIDDVDGVPDGPAVIVANEFFDALPVRQFERGQGGWHERLVGLDETGGLAFGLAPEPDPRITIEGPPGSIVEWPLIALAVAGRLARRVAEQGGVVLMLDYGSLRSGLGDTLQAVKAHAFVDPLAEPGEADLTAHVAFEAFAQTAAACGAAVHGPVAQGEFLDAIGIAARAKVLRRRASAAQAEAIEAALERLTGNQAGGMGELFKVLAFSHPVLTALPGFAPAAAPALAAS